MRQCASCNRVISKYATRYRWVSCATIDLWFAYAPVCRTCAKVIDFALKYL
jgi:hypothetical protein